MTDRDTLLGWPRWGAGGAPRGERLRSPKRRDPARGAGRAGRGRRIVWTLLALASAVVSLLASRGAIG